jgi:serine/threonine-protein kinase
MPLEAHEHVADPLIGQEPLGQYRIVRRIGSGAFGAVYLAEQPGVRRLAVVKVLHARLHGSHELTRRFAREAAVLAALDHHHIVRLYNFGALDDGQLFLAMEWGGDRTLAREIRTCRRLQPQRALRIAEQVCEALAEAHEHGVVHRDLKPANILLGSKGARDWAKVVDVGIARLVDDERFGAERLTAAGVLIGTPEYFAPEQACGLPADARADLYSLGVVLYEMLTGRLPLRGSTPADFVRAHAGEAPLPMADHGVAVPEAVERAVAKALEKDPARRYRSAREMRAALARARVSLRPARSRLRRRLFALGAAGLALAAAALAAPRPHPRRPPKAVSAGRSGSPRPSAAPR